MSEPCKNCLQPIHPAQKADGFLAKHHRAKIYAVQNDMLVFRFSADQLNHLPVETATEHSA